MHMLYQMLFRHPQNDNSVSLHYFHVSQILLSSSHWTYCVSCTFTSPHSKLCCYLCSPCVIYVHFFTILSLAFTDVENNKLSYRRETATGDFGL